MGPRNHRQQTPRRASAGEFAFVLRGFAKGEDGCDASRWSPMGDRRNVEGGVHQLGAEVEGPRRGYKPIKPVDPMRPGGEADAHLLSQRQSLLGSIRRAA